jgi:transposase
MDEERRKLIQKMYCDDGMSSNEIRDTLRCNMLHIVTVRKELKKEGIIPQDFRKRRRDYRIKFEDVKRMYVDEGKNITEIAKILKCGFSNVARKLRYLQKKGKIPKLSGRNCGNFKLQNKIVDLYNRGFGVKRIARMLSIGPSSASYRMRKAFKMGTLINQHRGFIAKGIGSKRRRRGLKKMEFSYKTKKERFEEEKGICEICHNFISNNCLDAVYHHRIPIARSGDKSKKNCMVLHEDCHKKFFYELHGFLLRREVNESLKKEMAL